MKVRIKDICTAASPGIANRSSAEVSPFIGLQISSNIVTASVFTEKPQSRLIQRIFPKEGIDIHCLCAILNGMNLKRFLRNTIIPLSFRDYCDEELELPSIEKLKHISTILQRIQRVIDIRKKQIDTGDRLQKSMFAREFGKCVPNAQDPYWFKLSDVSERIVNRIHSKTVPDSGNNWIYICVNGNNELQVGKVPSSETPMPRHICLIQTNPVIIEPDFLIKTMGMPYFKTMIMQNIHKSPFRINLDIRDLYVYCPPLTVQRQFLEKIQKSNILIELLRQNTSQWERIYKSCTQKYFFN